MDATPIEDLDARGTLASVGRLRRARDTAEREIFLAAAHYADLFTGENLDPERCLLPGMETGVRLAGVGTPLVRELALAELGAELGITSFSARLLVGDALEVRHRLPRLWARVRAGQVPVWIARKVARETRDLTIEQAGFVDAEVAPVADGRLPFSRFATLLAGKVVAADPEAAAERERAAAAERFAKVGRSNEHGQKTLYVRTDAAAIIRIDATVDYLARALQALGDPDPLEQLRVKALLVLANPVAAVQLLHTYTQHRGASGGAGAGPGGRYDDDDHPLPEPPPDPEDEPSEAEPESADDVSGPLEPEPEPESAGEPDPGDPKNAEGREPSGAGLEPVDRPGPTTAPDDRCESCGRPGSSDPPDQSPGGVSPPDGDPSPFLRPFRPGELDRIVAAAATGTTCATTAGTSEGFVYDPRRLLPTVTLYLHVATETLAAGEGVVRWEDQGPVTLAYLRDVLGPTCRFTIRPVLDLAGQAPVDGYEIPHRLREALHLRTPADVFPYAPNTSRRTDLDHTRPYRPPAHGGPPGQTSAENLGPLTRYHHRVKTHTGWQSAQPFPGTYLWRAPHGALYLTDHTGTTQIRPTQDHPHQLDRTAATSSIPPEPARHATVTRLEQRFTDHITQHAA